MESSFAYGIPLDRPRWHRSRQKCLQIINATREPSEQTRTKLIKDVFGGVKGKEQLSTDPHSLAEPRDPFKIVVVERTANSFGFFHARHRFRHAVCDAKTATRQLELGVGADHAKELKDAQKLSGLRLFVGEHILIDCDVHLLL